MEKDRERDTNAGIAVVTTTAATPPPTSNNNINNNNNNNLVALRFMQHGMFNEGNQKTWL